MSEEGVIHKVLFIKDMAISQEYTVILRQGYLEFYHTSKGPWEDRNIPDFLLTPEETDGLRQFLTRNQLENVS